jgi:hypothetical protein
MHWVVGGLRFNHTWSYVRTHGDYARGNSNDQQKELHESINLHIALLSAGFVQNQPARDNGVDF